MRQHGLLRACRAWIPTLGLFLMACGSSSSTTGTGGATAASGGATGSGGASGTGGAAAAFMAVNPCNLATDYVTAAYNTIAFGGTDLVYAPKCLKVASGAMVTFKGMGTETFSQHPLFPSTKRGTLNGNPIAITTDTSATKTFTFPTAGYYAYYCQYHGPDDSGDFMAGVIWVQ